MSISHAVNQHLLFQNGTMKWPEEPAKYDAKRFGYKARGVRYPLRLSLPNEDEPAAAAPSGGGHVGGSSSDRQHAPQQGREHAIVGGGGSGGRPQALPLPPARSDRHGSGGGGSAGPRQPQQQQRTGRARRSSSADDSGLRHRHSSGGGGAAAAQSPNEVEPRAGAVARRPALDTKLGPGAGRENDKARGRRAQPDRHGERLAGGSGGDDASLVTQEQLARILATIGQVSGLTGDPVKIVLGDGVTVEVKPRAPEQPRSLVSKATVQADHHRDGISALAALALQQQPHQQNKQQQQHSVFGDADSSNAVGSGLKDGRPSAADQAALPARRHEQPQQPQQQHSEAPKAAAPAAAAAALPPLPRSHMTIAEQKRQQWEAERQELARLQAEREELAIAKHSAPAAPAAAMTAANGSGGGGGGSGGAVAPRGAAVQPSETAYRREPAPPAALPPPERRRPRTPVRTVQQAAASDGGSMHVEPSFVPGLGFLTAPSHDDAKQTLDAQDGSQLGTYLSKSEKKKLQWAREQADALPSYNPWGRPSAGVNPMSTAAAAPPVLSPPPAQYGAGLPPAKYGAGLPPVVRAPYPAKTDASVVAHAAPTVSNNEIVELTSPKPPVQPRAPPTKADLMKMKWAKDRAENPNAELYDPWGRPGAGAPIRSQSGRVLTDYHSRLNEVIRSSVENNTNSVEAAGASGGGTWANKTDASAAVGGGAGSPHRHAATAVVALQAHTAARSDSAPIPALLDTYGITGSFSAASASGGSQGPPAAGRSHIRGQLTPLDPVTLREREDQRRRQLQHQEEIRRQVEEKQRLQRQETDRRAREEAELEQRLASERSRLQAQFDFERDKSRRKEIEEQERIAQLKAAMDKAQLAAEAEKAAKTLSRLQLAGHDVSQLKATYAEKLTPRLGADDSAHLPPPNAAGTATVGVIGASSQATAGPPSLPTAGAAHNGGVDVHHHVTPRLKPAVLLPVVQDAYVENRLLTPSQHRRPHHVPALPPQFAEPLSPLREFGTQTDEGDRRHGLHRGGAGDAGGHSLGTGVAAAAAREPAAAAAGAARRKTRRGATTHAADEAAVAATTDRAAPAHDRRAGAAGAGPKPWGYQNEQRQQYVKQSERDVDFERKRELETERKAERERRIIKQVEANSPRVPAHAASRPSRRPAADSHDPQRQQQRQPVKAGAAGAKRTMLNENATTSREPAPAGTTSSSVGATAVVGSLSQTAAASAGGLSRAAAGGDVTDRLLVTPVDGFMPFTRSDVVLDPVNASEPVPVSREPTANGLARQAYARLMHPAAYGAPLDDLAGAHGSSRVASDRSLAKTSSASLSDSLYGGHDILHQQPLARQDQLMEQLRLMRQGLLQKQREMENHLLPEATVS